MNNISNIIEAVELGEHGFSTLKGVELERCADGGVFCIAGGESVILKAIIEGELFAIKCYTVKRVGLKERYDMLRELSRQDNFVIDMTYLENELLVIDNYGVQRSVDVLLYRWVEGVTLMQSIERCIEFYDVKTLLILCRRFILFARKVLSLPITHGDIKPQNIIVCDNGSMVLIDYDMSFTDSVPCVDVVRTQWYQHPKSDVWDEDYSLAVIGVSIFLLSLDPLLFHKYHNGENIILDAHKITNSGVINRDILSLLEPYPNYMALFEEISSSRSTKCSISGLLANIFGEKPLECTVIDDKGVLRRVVCEKGLYGFVDSSDNLVVGCCYGDATPFNDGVAAVSLHGAWYIFGEMGICATQEVYEEVGVSNDGVIPVCKDRRWFYISSYTFNPICDNSYDYAYPFSCGVGLVRSEDRFFFIDVSGNSLFGAKTFKYARPYVGGYAVVCDDKYYVIDVYGRQVVCEMSERILSYDGKSLSYRDGDNGVRVVPCGI